MTRAILVGVIGALVLLVLISISTYLEVRYMEFGEFVRDSSAEMQKQQVSPAYKARYGDPINYLSKWVRLNQLLVDPVLCMMTGALVGLFTRRAIIATAIVVAPVLLLNTAPDPWAAVSIGFCTTGCWSLARATRYLLDRRLANTPLPA